MKKKTNSITKTIIAPKVYLEDVEEIINILSKVTKASDIKISTEEYDFEDLEDLKHSESKRLKKLEIQSSNPYCRISLSPISGWINASSETTDEVYLVTQIGELLKKSERMSIGAFLLFYSNIYIKIFMYIVVIGLFLIGIIPKQKNDLFVFFAFIGYFLTFIMDKVGQSMSEKGSIYLEYRSNFKNFWVRKKDDLVVGVIVGTITLLLGLLLGYFIGKIK